MTALVTADSQMMMAAAAPTWIMAITLLPSGR